MAVMMPMMVPMMVPMMMLATLMRSRGPVAMPMMVAAVMPGPFRPAFVRVALAVVAFVFCFHCLIACV